MKKSEYVILAAVILFFLWRSGGTAPDVEKLTPDIRKRTAARVKSLYWKLIVYFAGLYKVPPKTIAAIIAQESGGNLNAKGAAGEIGLMQLKPVTFEIVNKKLDLDKTLIRSAQERGTGIYDFLFGNIFSKYEINYYDEKVNIQYGAAYLSILLDETGNLEAAIKRYNGSGPMAEKYKNSIKEYETYF